MTKYGFKPTKFGFAENTNLSCPIFEAAKSYTLFEYLSVMMLKPLFTPPMLKTRGWIWNGSIRLEGELLLDSASLSFQFKDFPESHINFAIPLHEIESVKSFLLFDLVRNGLHIKTIHQKNEYFVVENVDSFKKILEKKLSSIKMVS